MTTESLQASTYEVLRKRLRDGADDLRKKFQALNADRAEVFGNLDSRLLSTIHVTTDHNCVPRDLVVVGSKLLLGYNVQFGLKNDVAPKDVFNLYRLDDDKTHSEPLGPWFDDRFCRDFSELYRYYRNTIFTSFFQAGPLLYMVFQVGKTPQDIKAFKWVIEESSEPSQHGQTKTLRYLDNRSETEIRYPEQHDFRWNRATRDQHRSGLHPHVSIGDIIFVECVGGDLTIKVEDNTASGSGIYSEPVDNPDQTLDDAEIHYCILGNLVLLKIRPYQEKDFRYIVFSVKRRQAIRLDAMKQACTQLPDDHGIIFPGGVFLQTGTYRIFDHGLTDVLYQRTIIAPNGEDYLYQFFQPASGTYLHLRYNLIRQEVDTPLVCHGQSFMDNGHMISMRVHEASQKHHALQLWQTPFTSPDYKVHVTTDSMLYKIGNRDLVRCMAECQEVLQLIDKDESYADLYVDLVKRPTDILDSYFWLDREETHRLSQPLVAIRDAASAAVDEYEKVVRVRKETTEALLQTQSAATELIKAAERSRFESVAAFVKMLADLRAQRGHAIGLRELRYIDVDLVDQLESDLVSTTRRIGERCVQFLLNPAAMEPYRERIRQSQAKIAHIGSVAGGRELEKELGEIAEQLELLIETVAQLPIDDLTQRTSIVDRTADLLAELNRVRSSLKASLRALLSTEMEAEFASQSKLLDQSSAGALDAISQPEKVDEALSRILLQLEELESRFAEHESLVERLHEKREALVAAFESRRQQIVEARSRRAAGLVQAAERVLSGIASRSGRIEEADQLRAFFASDPMVDKVRKIAEQLLEIGDSVRADDVLSKLKTLADDSLRQQRDRHELYVDGQNLIRLGHHVFSVNHQAAELTTVVQDGQLRLHLTGTQFYSPLEADELLQARDLWQMNSPSETSHVYRAETLAYDVLNRWQQGATIANWSMRDFEKSSPEDRVAWLRDWMQPQHECGYSRGIHDWDGALLLNHLIELHAGLGLLRFHPATRAVAWYGWQKLVPEQERRSTEQWVQSYGNLNEIMAQTRETMAYRRQIAKRLIDHGGRFVRQVPIKEAAEYLFEQLIAENRQAIVSPRAAQWLSRFETSLSDSARERIAATLATHSQQPLELWQLGVSIVDAGLKRLKVDDDNSLEPIADYRLEIVRLLVSDFDPSHLIEAKGVHAGRMINGLHGDHPNIASGNMRLNYHEFTGRLKEFASRIVPRYEAYQNKKRQLLHQAQRELRTDEFKARVLTSFVRNRLIDEVFLPRIGENLAKQLGAAGENKRTDRMGLLLLLSPPGYGKTTLMEYIANRLGLVFVKINGPALGHDVRSLDPSEVTNASAREEVGRITMALEMGDNVMLYLDDIQHCHTELLQKFIPLCDATRRIEGVWKGQSKAYDLRGRKVAVVMAGNPYTESGERFQIPDMLANRADVYNLGEIIGGAREAFEQSYLENCLTSNLALLPLARASRDDISAMLQAAQRNEVEMVDSSTLFSADQLTEMMSVLKKLVVVRDVVLKVNRQYIQSAAQADAYRTEPPFKLQGSYRNMNRIAEKVAAVMNDDELMTLVVSAYEQEAQTLTRDSESNLLKFREMIGIITPDESQRWQQICYAYRENVRLSGMTGDDQAMQILKSLTAIRDGLETIRLAIHFATEQTATNGSSHSVGEEVKGLTDRLGELGGQLLELVQNASVNIERASTTLPDQKVLVQHSVPRSMTELVRSQYQLLYDGLKHLLDQSASQSASLERVRQSLSGCLSRYSELQLDIDTADKCDK